MKCTFVVRLSPFSLKAWIRYSSIHADYIESNNNHIFVTRMGLKKHVKASIIHLKTVQNLIGVDLPFQNNLKMLIWQIGMRKYKQQQAESQPSKLSNTSVFVSSSFSQWLASIHAAFFQFYQQWYRSEAWQCIALSYIHLYRIDHLTLIINE